MNKALKTIIIILVVVIIAAIGYALIAQPEAPSESGSTTPLQTQSGQEVEGLGDIEALPDGSQYSREFLSLLLNLQAIRLDGAIFQDPAFISLEDNRVEIDQPGNQYRANPFAPVGLLGTPDFSEFGAEDGNLTLDPEEIGFDPEVVETIIEELDLGENGL